MKQFNYCCAIALWILLSGYNVVAQNPNWTIPGQYFKPAGGLFNLPSSPYNPTTGQPQTSTALAYQVTTPNTNVHAGYTDPWGDLMFFTVDENLYDYKGWLVGSFRKDFLN